MDFQAIALLSCLTKLHFDGFSSDLDFNIGDVNKLSALASLQYLNLQFFHTGQWCVAIDELDIHLKTSLKVENMQLFQVISIKSDRGDDGLMMGAWSSDSDMSSDTDSDMYSQHSNE